MLLVVVLAVVVLCGAAAHLSRVAVVDMHLQHQRALTHCLKCAIVADIGTRSLQSGKRNPSGNNRLVSWMGTDIETFAVPYPTATAEQTVNGLADESGKLNLNSILTTAISDTEAKERLMQIPGVSDLIADSLLDWVDEDDEPRPNGAEKSYYSSRGMPNLPPNDNFLHENELLAVKGVTPILLFGEDANGNGWLDANENDGSTTLPVDNGDDVLDRGLLSYLTVCSKDSDYVVASPLIDINTANLVQLHDAVSMRLGDEVALFITALRLYGPANWDAPVEFAGESFESRIHTQHSFKRDVDTFGVTYRQGLRLATDGTFTVSSLFDLLDTEVTCIIGTADTVLVSPWPSTEGSYGNAIRQLEAIFSCAVPGRNRININTAAPAVLNTIPRIPDATLKQILTSRSRQRESTSLSWLPSVPLISLEQLRTLGRYGCRSGCVFSGHIVATHKGHASGLCAQVMIDYGNSKDSVMRLTFLPEVSRVTGSQRVGTRIRAASVDADRSVRQ